MNLSIILAHQFFIVQRTRSREQINQRKQIFLFILSYYSHSMNHRDVFNQILKYNGLKPNDRQILHRMYNTNTIDIKIIDDIIERTIWNYLDDADILKQLIYQNSIDPVSASSQSMIDSKELSDMKFLRPIKKWRLVNGFIDIGQNSLINMRTVATVHLTPFTFSIEKGSRKPGVQLDNPQFDAIGKHEFNWDIWRDEIFAKTNPYWEVDHQGITKDEVMRDPKYQLMNGDLMSRVIHDVRDIYVKRYNDMGKWNILNPPPVVNKSGFWQDDPVFYQKLIVREPNSQVLIIGDLHSSFHSLCDIINENRHLFDGKSLVLKHGHYIIFLGDIVDRGPYSVELLLLTLYLKKNNPDQVIIINGNHEDYYMHNATQGVEMLSSEARLQFGDRHPAVAEITRLLYFLPSTVFLNYNNEWHHLSHGAFDIKHGVNSDILRNWLGDNTSYIVAEPTDWGHGGYQTHDSKWGDFDQLYRGYITDDHNGRNKFGSMITKKYLEYNNIKCIIRGHQDVQPINIIREYNDGTYDGYNQSGHIQHNDDFGVSGHPQQMRLDLHPEYINFSGIKFYLKKVYSEIHDSEYMYRPDIDRDQRFPMRIDMKPGEDFMVLTTSTAVVSRKLKCNAYILFTSKVTGN
jgi:hypothetical protein